MSIEHRTERRTRETLESFCAEPGCEYAGQPAVQGHCFHVLDDVTEQYIARAERIVEEGLEFYRAQHSGDDYIRTLESLYVSADMNWHFTLDELVRLRRENAALKAAAAKERA